MLTIEQSELISNVQQFLPTSDVLNTRLVNHQWKQTLDDNNRFWKARLDYLIRTVLPQSYLLRGYWFKEIPKSHYLSKRSRTNTIVHTELGLKSSGSDQSLVDFYYHDCAHNYTSNLLKDCEYTASYNRFSIVVQQLEKLKKQTLDPDIAKSYLMKAIWMELHGDNILFAAVIGVVLTTIVAALFVQWQQIAFTALLVACTVMMLFYIVEYILRYLSNTMRPKEHYYRLVTYTPVIINLLCQICFYRTLILSLPKLRFYSAFVILTLQLYNGFCRAFAEYIEFTTLDDGSLLRVSNYGHVFYICILYAISVLQILSIMALWIFS
jgi:hypothetical protein